MPPPNIPASKRPLLLKDVHDADWTFTRPTIWRGNVEQFLSALPRKIEFDLIVSSPPYNIGKEYERRKDLPDYLSHQAKIIRRLVKRMAPHGSLCWQVGNYVRRGEIVPLDVKFHRIFERLGLKLRNRIVWRFGHGLHAKRRFSGRYEVVLWYTKSDKYNFHLDRVRVPAKYPGKKAFKGERKGQYSSNPDGKNPEDVWDIPNVKGNHIEKTSHPCQFPVGLVERLVLALTNKNDLVFDPYAGVASAGVAALAHHRRFVGCERNVKYAQIGKTRLLRTAKKTERYRPHNKPIYDHTKSKLSIAPKRKRSASSGKRSRKSKMES